jgi:hypothetical protein
MFQTPEVAENGMGGGEVQYDRGLSRLDAYFWGLRLIIVFWSEGGTGIDSDDQGSEK